MQFYLNGYRPGDPAIQSVAPAHRTWAPGLPDAVDVLIVGSGPAGAVLAAQLSSFADISTRLIERRDDIEGCILTHGHEDHVGALSYALAELSFPIIGSALTLGLARSRIEEAGLLGRTQMIVVEDGERRSFGRPVAGAAED